ncbi:MAG: MATE family efflux transporter, partial [Ruthenibacterium sp.]
MSEQNSMAKESLLSEVKPAKAMIKLAVPATIALLAKAVYNIVDTAYIGLLDSELAL